jgi:hypothetical protein
VGLDDAKLVQRACLAPAVLLLPGQVERPACVFPGLLATSGKATDLAALCQLVGTTLPPTRAEADRLLQQRVPLREAPLECIGSAQTYRDPLQPGLVAGGTTEGQALVEHPDGLRQVSLAEVHVAEAAVGMDRHGPAAFPCGEAERLLPVTPPLGEGPERTQGLRQKRLGLDPHSCTGLARLPIRRLHVPPQ